MVKSEFGVEKMKILKIIADFVTNSSSAGTSILLAVKKGKDFSSLMSRLGIPKNEIKYFTHDLNIIQKWIKGLSRSVEYNDLLNEYNIKMGNFTTDKWGDEPNYHKDCYSYDILREYMCYPDEPRKHVIGEDLILLKLWDWTL